MFRWNPGETVTAVAYDNPIPGFGTNNTINLRLWAAKPDREFDLQAFNTGDYVQVGRAGRAAEWEQLSAAQRQSAKLVPPVSLTKIGSPHLVAGQAAKAEHPLPPTPPLLLQAILSKQRAETLSSVLYPDDRTYEGKELRLKQQHFFVSATVQVGGRGVGRGWGFHAIYHRSCCLGTCCSVHPPE